MSINKQKEKKNYFYVIDSGSNSNQHMFSDVKKEKNMKQLSYIFNINNAFLRLLNKIHFSIKINKIIDLPFKSIWDSKYAMNEMLSNSDTTKWIIVTNWSIRRFGLSYLKKMEKRKDVRLILLYLDPLSAVPEFYLKFIKKMNFDMIYSFDEEDCEKYGWKYTTSLYSMNEIPNNNSPEYDVFYIGLDKGRAQLLDKIYKKLVDNNVKCNFLIVSETGKSYDNGKGLCYLNHRVSYDEVLSGISNAKVILEVVQEGQTGMTMRPYEAIFYNRKLLTNNPKIKEMDFFRQDYMNYFSSEKDLDIGFIKNTEKVDFQYHNEYSPVNWISKIPDDYVKSI